MKKISITLLLSAAITVAFADNSFRSFKRGFGENTLYYAADLQVLAKGCSWFYNWASLPTAQVADMSGTDKVCEFVPMAWNGNFDETQLKAYYDSHPGDKYLLGFNEPNFTDQAHMTPQEAVEPWHKLEQFAKSNGLTLVAPALNYSSWTAYSTPEKWMDAFITAYKMKYGTAPSYDYLALHCYMDDPLSMLTYVENYAKKYSKQVWLTEFCAWESATLTAEQQLKYMINKIEMLEKSSSVYRYAWFKARNSDTYPYYNLVEYPVKSKGITAGTLTNLGFAYVHMSPCDTTKFYNVNEVIPANAFIDQYNLERIQISNDPRAIDSTEVYLHGTNATLTYQVNVPSDGIYHLILRASTTASSLKSRISILDADGTPITTGHNLPNTGSEDTYMADTTMVLSLKAGKQKLIIKKENAKVSNLTLLKLVQAIDTSDEDLRTLTGDSIVKPNTGGNTGGGTSGSSSDTVTVDGVKITDAESSPFQFKADDKFYCIYLDDKTKKANISDDRYVNCGDNGTSQNSYVWENTYNYGDITGSNSFGVTGSYTSLVVADKGWSGMGYNVNSETGDLDLSCVNVDYTLHFSLKSESSESVDIYIADGSKHTAHLVFGEDGMDGHSPIGNFKRDGKWHNIDIPMNHLQNKFGINFNKDTDYNGNLFCINCGGTKGTDISYDGIFFYGPMNSKPDADVSGFDITVSDINAGNISGLGFPKSDRYYGIFLDNETRTTNISEDNYTNCGDNGTNQNLYLWENTFSYGTPAGNNSFGVAGGYTSLIVNNSSWTGMGYHVAESSTPLNLSAINSEYMLHFAIRATNNEPIEVVLNDGKRDAAIVLGDSATSFDGHPSLTNFTRDGNWHEIFVPMAYLNSKFGINFSTATNYTGNLFVIRTNPVVGNVVDYDAVFIYGPSSSIGLETDTPDDRTITINAAADSLFKFSANDDYYIIYLDKETRNSYLQEDQVTDLGPDDVTRHLYTWSDTFTTNMPLGNNSFGVSGSYEAWTVGSQGWSGLGYNIVEGSGLDLSNINSKYTLHFAVKSTYTGTIEFYVVDGNGKTAFLPLGTEAFENHACIGDFKRDGNWYNIDIPVSYLIKHGLDYRTATNYSGNIFCLLAGGVEGTEVDYDAVFFHGPNAVTQGIKSIENDMSSINHIQNLQIYNMYGILIGRADSMKDLNLGKGVYIIRSASNTKKVIFK